jgi:hypothetical protein
MTSRERAYEVARKWLPDSEPDSMKVITLMAHIELAIDAALEEEREAIVEIAGNAAEDRSMARYVVGYIIGAIRARGAK